MKITKEKYIERDLEKQLERYMPKKEMIAILGARQCGKTTLINFMLDKEEEKGKKVNRLSFDNQIIFNLFETDLESFIELHVKGFDILFIDEVQYSKDSGKKLKYIYDSFNIKVILTGSSAIDVSINSIKFLVGRINIFYLYPFSFREFLKEKNEKLVKLYDLGEYGKEVLNELNSLLKEFIIYGGYPRVVLSKTIEEKKKVLQDIYSTLLLREVRDLVGLAENQKLILLLKSLSLQMGNLIDYSELGKISGFDSKQIKNIFKVIEDSFIFKRVSPFFKNKRTELYKNPKVYFLDPGLRNVALSSFEFIDYGSLYENFIFSELMKKERKTYFWRTKSKAEIDFIVEKDNKFFPIEIKSKLIDTSITRSYHSFLDKYNPNEGFFLSKDYDSSKIEGKTLIKFKSFVKFIGSF